MKLFLPPLFLILTSISSDQHQHAKYHQN